MRFLKRPLRQWYVNQKFGENNACVDLATGKNTILCDGLHPPAGYKSVYSQMKGHNALDLMAITGTEVYSAHDGIVEEVENDPARGLGLGIVSFDKFPIVETGNTCVKTRYWHLKSFAVKKGDLIKAGQIIGYANNTGYSAGSHLHFELKPVTYRLKDGKISFLKNTLQDNGYFGAIDPSPYLEGSIYFPFDLSRGMRNEYVKVLQECLISLGFAISSPTGYFGDETFFAVKAFQKKYKKSVLWAMGLKLPTGYFGASSRRKMEELFS